MLGPTIYIPSGLAKLLIPLTTCRQMLPVPANRPSTGARHGCLWPLSPAA